MIWRQLHEGRSSLCTLCKKSQCGKSGASNPIGIDLNVVCAYYARPVYHQSFHLVSFSVVFSLNASTHDIPSSFSVPMARSLSQVAEQLVTKIMKMTQIDV